MSGSIKTYQMVINGKLVNSCDDDWINVENPAKKTIFARVPRGKAADVNIAVAAAKKAFTTWSKTSAPERGKLLYAIADGLEKNQRARCANDQYGER